MKQVIGGLLPELTKIGFTDSRVCSPNAQVQNALLTYTQVVLVHGQHR